MNMPIKDIEITYNSGEKYTVHLADESYANAFGCLLDDDTVSVSYDISKTKEGE